MAEDRIPSSPCVRSQEHRPSKADAVSQQYRFADVERVGMGSWMRHILWRNGKEEANAFERVVGRWAERCIVCHVQDRDAEHRTDKCTRRGKAWVAIKQKRDGMRRARISRQFMERFAMCSGRLQLQRVCKGWTMKTAK